MKQTFLVLFLASLIIPSFAQKFSVGIKGGALYGTMRYQDKDLRDRFSNRPTLGYMGGGFISFPLPDGFSFVAESMFSRKGRKLMYNESVTDSTYFAETNNNTFYFIENSLMLRKEFRLGLFKFNSSLFFNIGPNILYWMGGSGYLSNTKSDGRLDYKINFVDSVFYDNSLPADELFGQMQVIDGNRWIWGLDIGLGYKAQMFARHWIVAEARITYGHTHLGKAHSPNLYRQLSYDDNFMSAFRTLNVTLGYAFNLDLQAAKKGKSTLKVK